MFARVTRTTFDPKRIDELEPVVREQVLPAMQQMAGFQGMWALADRETGAGLTFSLWESEEAMRASEAAADQVRSGAAASAGADVAAVERYEVVFQTD
jgi:heme-degrading monooxygenase HmoA